MKAIFITKVHDSKHGQKSFSTLTSAPPSHEVAIYVERIGTISKGNLCIGS